MFKLPIEHLPLSRKFLSAHSNGMHPLPAVLPDTTSATGIHVGIDRSACKSSFPRALYNLGFPTCSFNRHVTAKGINFMAKAEQVRQFQASLGTLGARTLTPRLAQATTSYHLHFPHLQSALARR